MGRALPDSANTEATAGPPARRLLTGGHGWRISEYVCTAGPGDRPFEERHDTFALSAVVEGTFRYRSSTGTAFLYPGAFLLGNHGTCYECGHDHSKGDRCIAVHIEPELFAEVAATVAGSSRYVLPLAMLPPMPTTLPFTARLAAVRAQTSPHASHEFAIRLLENVLGTVCGQSPRAAAASARDERRVCEVVRYIWQHADTEVDLDALAARAAMSKYHFLRIFRRIVGMTPYQFLLDVRMRRAAASLLTTDATVSAIAFEAGFGDLSTFNARFKRQLGASPRAFRRNERKP